MTDTTITLTDKGKIEAIGTAMRQARNQFQNLEKDKIHIGIKHHYLYRPSWIEAFEIVWQGTPNTTPKNMDIELKEEENNQLTIISHNPDFDKVAIWISQQLDRAYKKINVQVNKPELTNSEGSWKCDHCGTTVRSNFLSCPVCGANKP